MKTPTLALACVLLASAAPALAGQITGTVTIGGSPGQWQGFPSQLGKNVPTRAYWDNASMDPHNENIGYWLRDSYLPSLPAISRPASLSWWGYDAKVETFRSLSTNAPRSMTMINEPGTQYQAQILLEAAAYAGVNEIGWYDAGDQAGQEELHPFFMGADGVGHFSTFTPSGEWGLYIRSHRGFTPESGNGWLFFSESDRNRTVNRSGDAVPGQQHFAIFGFDLTRDVERYVVGVEDLTIDRSSIEKQGDFNDSVFTLRVVPTPGAAALVGLGGILASRRRRR